jgi:hypothetical protein
MALVKMRAFSTEKLPLEALGLPIEGGQAESRGRIARFYCRTYLGNFLIVRRNVLVGWCFRVRHAFRLVSPQGW